MSIFQVFVAALAVLPFTTKGHMTMKKPVPFGTPIRDPLNQDGSNFPCQIPLGGQYQINTMNEWPVGSTQVLQFDGTAVHGGGSCQISVSPDKAPTKASKWKVIYSIEGSCPPAPPVGPNGVGVNYDEFGPQPYLAFNFTILPELPNGEMVMSWSWLNRIGQREYYQNCAPITVSGGADDTTAFDALPDMVIANIPSLGKCETTPNKDYTFPNPGQYAIRPGLGPFLDVCGGPASAPPANGTAPVPPANPAVPAQPSQPPAAPSIPPADAGDPAASKVSVSPSGSAPTPSGQQGTAIASPSACTHKPSGQNSTAIASPSAAQPSPQVSPAMPSAASPSAQLSQAVPSAAKPSPQVSQSAPSPAAPAPSREACSPDGAIVCSPDSKRFALCNHGKAIFQVVAAGTSCKDSKIVKRAEYASTMKTVYTYA